MVPVDLHLLITTLETVFICFLFRSPPHIPQVRIPEDLAVKIAQSLRFEINRSLASLREIALGRDLKKFLAVCFELTTSLLLFDLHVRVASL